MESLTDEIHDHAIQLDNQQGSNTELQKNLDQAMTYLKIVNVKKIVIFLMYLNNWEKELR